ncbi:MAG: hypothetical protein GWO24_34935, partial [Akkermansiaceae bacterium]|nr:hypothetical protein [Akkermansiaceae bacterium]
TYTVRSTSDFIEWADSDPIQGSDGPTTSYTDASATGRPETIYQVVENE